MHAAVNMKSMPKTAVLLGQTVLQVPEVQSTPFLLGTQKLPEDCLARQHPGCTMLFRCTQYSSLSQPVESSEHEVQISRVCRSSPFTANLKIKLILDSNILLRLIEFVGGLGLLQAIYR